ncbi:MAG: translocation/assembly module TamB domain-containing protein [Myxococcota bacterium]
MTITGSPSTPVVEGAVNWLEPSIGGQALDGAYLALTPADGGYALDLAVTVPGGGGLTVQGPVPVTIDLDKDVADWATGDLALAVAGTDLPLGLLSSIDPRFRDGSGVLSVEGTVGGTALRPVPDLVATIAGGAFEYPDLGLRAEDVDVRLEFDKQRIRLDHADLVLIPSHRFQTAGLTEGERPRVHVTGAAMLDEWTPTAMSAKAVLSGGPWLSATEGTTLRTDGELQIGGSWPNLTVNGDLDVVYGRIQLDAAALLDDTPLRPDASLSIVRSDAPPPVAAPVVPPVYADFDVNVSADLKRNLELSMSVPFLEDLGEIGAAVTRADVATRLGGKVDLRMENQSPTLVGAVEVVDGQVRVLQSTFTLADGTITFAGGDPYADANLDLHGSMAVQGATLEVAITGTPPDPDFELTSDEYADLTEKMTILLTGKAPEELSSNQGAAATEALAGVLFNSLFAGQSFGTLTIEPNGSARLGVPVTPSVYATSTIVPMATDPNENSLAVEVEWTLLPRMVATAGIGDRRQWSNVYWEIRF